MAVNIGTLSTVVTVSSGELTTGLDAAGKKVEQFSARVEQQGDVLRKAAKGATALGAGLLTLAVARQAAGWIGELFAEVDRLSKAGRRLGLTAGDMRLLNVAAEQAGVTAEQVERQFTRMNSALQRADSESSKAGRALRLLGVDAAVFRGAGLLDQIGQLGDALQGVVDPAEKARIAIDLFGRRGIQTLTLLEGGSKQIDDLKQRLGDFPPDATAQRIERFNDDVRLLSEDAKTFGLQISEGFFIVADSLAQLAGTAIDLATGASLDAALSATDAFVNRTVESAGAAAASLRDIEAAAEALGERAAILAKLEESVNTFGKTSTEVLLEELRGIEGVTEAEKARAQALADALRQKEEELKLSRELEAQRERERRAMEQIEQQNQDAIASLEKQIATFGKSARAVEIYEAELRNANNKELGPFIDQLRKLDKQLTELEQQAQKMAALQQSAASLAQSLQTPFERFEDDIAHIQELFAQGLIDEDLLTRAVQRAVEQAAETELPVALRLPGGATAGSREEVMLRTQGDLQKQQLERQKRIADVAARQLEEIRAMRAAIEAQNDQEFEL